MNYKANKKFLVMALSFCFIFILVFTLVLRQDMRKLENISINQYDISTPENFDYNINIQENDEAIIISGYMIMLNEVPEYIENYLVFYNKDTDTYLKVPTSLDMTVDIDLPDDEGGYIFGKFTSLILKEDLDLNIEEYNIGFLYLSDGYNNLILTNQAVR